MNSQKHWMTSRANYRKIILKLRNILRDIISSKEKNKQKMI